MVALTRRQLLGATALAATGLWTACAPASARTPLGLPLEPPQAPSPPRGPLTIKQSVTLSQDYYRADTLALAQAQLFPVRRSDGQVAVVLLADGQLSVIHPDPTVSTGWTRTPINGVSAVSRLSVAPAASGGLTMQAVVAGELLTLNLDSSYLHGTSTDRGKVSDRVVLGAAYGAGAVHSYAFTDSGPTTRPADAADTYTWNVSVDSGAFHASSYVEYLSAGTNTGTSTTLTSVATVASAASFSCVFSGPQEAGSWAPLYVGSMTATTGQISIPRTGAAPVYDAAVTGGGPDDSQFAYAYADSTPSALGTGALLSSVDAGTLSDRGGTQAAALMAPGSVGPGFAPGPVQSVTLVASTDAGSNPGVVAFVLAGNTLYAQPASFDVTGRRWTTQPPVPVQSGIRALEPIRGTEPTYASFLVTGTDGSLSILERATPAARWTSAPIRIGYPTTATAPPAYVDVTTYRVLLTVTDAAGVPVAGQALSVTADQPATALQAVGSLTFSSTPTAVTTDEFGQVCLAFPATALGAPQLTVSTPGPASPGALPATAVVPDAELHAFLNGSGSLDHIPGRLTGSTLLGNPNPGTVQPSFPGLQGNATAADAVATAVRSLMTTDKSALPSGIQSSFVLDLTGLPALSALSTTVGGAFGSGVGSFFGDLESIGRAIESGAAKVLKVAHSAADAAVSLLVKIDGAVVNIAHLVASDIRTAARVVSGILSSLGAELDQALKWLRHALLAYATEAVRLGQVLIGTVTGQGGGLDQLTTRLSGAESAIQGRLSTLRQDAQDQIGLGFSVASSARTVGDVATASAATASQQGVPPVDHTDVKASWLLDRVKHATLPTPTPTRSPKNPATASLISTGNAAGSTFQQAVQTNFPAWFGGVGSDPRSLTQAQLLKVILGVVEEVAVGVLSDVVHGVFAGLEDVVADVRDALNLDLTKEPVIGDLLTLFGVKKLTIGELLGTLAGFFAVPVEFGLLGWGHSFMDGATTATTRLAGSALTTLAIPVAASLNAALYDITSAISALNDVVAAASDAGNGLGNGIGRFNSILSLLKCAMGFPFASKALFSLQASSVGPGDVASFQWIPATPNAEAWWTDELLITWALSFAPYAVEFVMTFVPGGPLIDAILESALGILLMVFSAHSATSQFTSTTTQADQVAAYLSAVYGWMTNALKWCNISGLNKALDYVPLGVLIVFDYVAWVPPFAYDIVQAKAAHSSGVGAAPQPSPGTAPAAGAAPFGPRPAPLGAAPPTAPARPPVPPRATVPADGRSTRSGTAQTADPLPAPQSSATPATSATAVATPPPAAMGDPPSRAGAAAPNVASGFDGVHVAEVAAGLLGAGAVAAVVAQQVRHHARSQAAAEGESDVVAPSEADEGSGIG